jgi:peptide-methionine (S)-S-oxide reductase
VSETFVLAGGCFWCLDAVYRQLRGVTKVTALYVGGTTDNPDYESVCAGGTGHVEAVSVEFDESEIPADVILDVFFTMHDPTQINRQGNDIGEQYRSVMFYGDQSQKQRFEAARDKARQWWPDEIVTQIEPLKNVHLAESYHQDFYNQNPTNGYCLAIAAPKVNKVRASFAEYLQAA